jgi:hypothetical protein
LHHVSLSLKPQAATSGGGDPSSSTSSSGSDVILEGCISCNDALREYFTFSEGFQMFSGMIFLIDICLYIWFFNNF